ncbi:hypothetical protein O5853_29285, partial [Escherichia coli]|nr:hypothetical protein [Escherichia coli]
HELDLVAAQLNNRPRKTLKFKTPKGHAPKPLKGDHHGNHCLERIQRYGKKPLQSSQSRTYCRATQ